MILSPDQIISLIGQIATWITVILVLLTLKEMEKQRRNAYRPEIILNSKIINVYMSRLFESTTPIPLYWSETILDFESCKKIENFYNPIFVDIYNLGNGAAKDIKIEWSYNFDKSIVELQDRINELNLPLLLECKEKWICLYHKDQPDVIIFDCHADDLVDLLDYILPVSFEKEPVTVELPRSIMLLISLHLLCHIKANEILLSTKDKYFKTNPVLFTVINEKYFDGAPTGSNLSFPEIKLKLSYTDIANTAQTRFLKGSITWKSICYFSLNNINDLHELIVWIQECMKCYVQFTEVKPKLVRSKN